MERPLWDETFMNFVSEISRRSVCRHYKVGAAFVKNNNRSIVFGYNGPPKGEVHCQEVGCAKEKDGVKLPAGSGKCRGAHAETNAIANAATEGINLSGCRVYCIFTPCYDCAKMLVNLGIGEFVYQKEYDSPEENHQVRRLFAERGIGFRQFNCKKRGE